MVHIHFTTADGQAFDIDAAPGDSLMRAAQSAGVPGIEAECGGVLACGTCRVRIPPDWQHRLPEAAEDEAQMLEYCDEQVPEVRLSCQIIVDDALAGLHVTVPETQY